MPHPRHYHRQLILHTILDRVLIPYRPAGLDKGSNPRRMRDLHTIVKGEESITRQHRSTQVELELPGLCYCLSHAVDTTRLPTTFPYQLPVLHQRNGVG